MMNVLFVATVGTCLTLLLRWGFKALPHEEWQIMATVPRRKERSGHWVGVNLTYYGLLTASAGTLAMITFLILMASIHVPVRVSLPMLGSVFLFCLPATRLVARIVERKPHTSSVAAGVFVGLLVAPLVVAVANLCSGDGAVAPMVPTITAMTVAYVLGEGLGRLACISFGCCYGKPITEVGPQARRLFERFHFAFHGETKKIAYASGLEGIKVVPIQALTAALYLAVGLLGMQLFLDSSYRAAYALMILLSQGWRVYSETLRADYRGTGRISTYQKMALVGIVYSLALLPVLPSPANVIPDLAAGLAALWDPVVIVFLQAIWAVMFIITGWSMVTGSMLTFHVHRDRI
jgi:hypothetical protein